jgi:hypothetical protein
MNFIKNSIRLSGLLVLFGISAFGMKLEFKLSGGYAYLNAKSINTGIAGWAEWRKKEAEANKNWFFLSESLDNLHSGIHLEGEILLSLSSRISISLGTGYLYSDVYERDVEVVAIKTSGPISQIFPTTVSAYPVVLSVYYFLPLTSKLQLYARGGGGMAWASFVNREAKKLESAEKYNYFQTERGTASGPVYMGGLGLAYQTDVGVRFFLEGLIRTAKIRGFSGENELEEQGMLYYYEEYDPALDFWQAKNEIRSEMPSGTNFRSVSEAEVDFSGFSVKIGFIIRF